MHQTDLIPNVGSHWQELPKAQYQMDLLQVYQGNELIEALPKLTSVSDMLDRLIGPEKDYGSFENLSTHERAQYLVSILQDFFYPTEQHFELAYKIDLMIRQGYRTRNISDVPCMEQRSGKANLLFVKGSAGEGKSKALSRVLCLYDQVVVHQKLNKAQVVYVAMDCPVDPSLKSICYALFESLQRVSKTDVMSNAFRKRSEPELKFAAKSALDLFHVGLVVIDNIENLFLSKNDPLKLISEIISLSATTNVPILLCGSAESENLFKSHAKVTFDVLGAGVMDWKLLPLTHSEGEGNEVSFENWDAFASELWKYQVVNQRKHQIPNDFKNTLFELSQGIPKLAISLFMATQLTALYTQKEAVTTVLLEQVEKKEFGLIRSQMQALKNNDDIALRSFEGLQLTSVASLMFKLQKEAEVKKHKVDNSKRSQLFNALLEQSVKTDIARQASNAIFKQFPDISVGEAVEKAVTWLNDNKEQVIEGRELNRQITKRKVDDNDRNEIEAALSEASKGRNDVDDSWFNEW